jgi:GTP-binding protein Era
VRILLNCKEIPYAVEIVTEEFFEDENHSHSFFDYGGARNAKGIIIGHKGTALKKVVDSC